MDARRVPERNLPTDPLDETADIARDRRAAGSPPGLPTPEQAKALSVPAHTKIGRSVAFSPGRARCRPLRDYELLSKMENLGLTSCLSATQPRQQRRKNLGAWTVACGLPDDTA